MSQISALDIQDSSVLNPILCQKTLETMALAAQQTSSPVSPHPLFFSSGACNAGSNGFVFPDVNSRISCPSDPTIIPTVEENCLRIVKGRDARTRVLSTADVNFLRNIQRNVNESNIFANKDDMLFSFYVPPDYLVYFFENDPRGRSLEDQETDQVLIVSGNHVQVNACRSELTLPNGKRFFEANAAVKSAVQTNIATASILGVSLNRFATSLLNREEPYDEQACSSAATFYVHRTPYVVVVEQRDFGSTLLDMCIQGRSVDVGTTSLNAVWRPQLPACDALVSTFCATTPGDDACACFGQQAELNRTFGRERKVPVCCFGSDPSGNQDLACAFNARAYKTREMLDNCCTLAQCKREARVLGALDPSASLSCVGDSNTFPTKEAKTTVFVEPFFDKITSIPAWVLAITVVTGVMILFYLILLVFC